MSAAAVSSVSSDDALVIIEEHGDTASPNLNVKEIMLGGPVLIDGVPVEPTSSRSDQQVKAATAEKAEVSTGVQSELPGEEAPMIATQPPLPQSQSLDSEEATPKTTKPPVFVPPIPLQGIRRSSSATSVTIKKSPRSFQRSYSITDGGASSSSSTTITPRESARGLAQQQLLNSARGGGTTATTTHMIPAQSVSHDSVFLFEPEEGTPLAEALAANATLKDMDRNTKHIQKILLKSKNLKKFNVVRRINKKIKHPKKEKLFSQTFKGNAIDGVHELYTLTVGMMLGLLCTVINAKDANRMELVLEDFSAVEKREFKPEGTNNPIYMTPPHKLGHTFKFKSYAPKVFNCIRQLCGIDTTSYMMSICGNSNFLEFMSNSRSGQFFFYSHDGKYMIKTQSKAENKFMKRILPYYYQFLMENPNSTLVRFLGMHRVKMYHLQRKHHFVIMSSVFDTPMEIHTIYDVKGSRVGREATQREKEAGGVLKDNDLVEAGRKFHLGSKKEKLLKQIEKDAMFLASLNIMDYSLLVGIHDRKTAAAQREREQEALDQSQTPSQQSVPLPMQVPPMQTQLPTISETETLNEPLPTGMTSDLNQSGLGVTSSRIAFSQGAPMHSNTPFRHQHSQNTFNTPSASADAFMQQAINTSRSSADNASTHSQLTQRESARTLIPSFGSTSGALGTAPSGASAGGAAGGPLVSARRRTSTVGSVGSAVSAASGASGASGGSGASSGSGSVRVDEVTVKLEESKDTDDDYIEEEEEEDDEEFDDESVFSDSVFGDPDRDNMPSPTCASSSNDKAMVENEIKRLKDVLGQGAKGMEGASVAKMFCSPSDFASITAHTIEKDTVLANHMAAIAQRQEQKWVNRPPPWTNRQDRGINSRLSSPSARGDEVYFIGIIDILQEYNFRKRSETFVKSFSEDVNLISSVNPTAYAKRFVQFLRDNTD